MAKKRILTAAQKTAKAERAKRRRRAKGGSQDGQTVGSKKLGNRRVKGTPKQERERGARNARMQKVRKKTADNSPTQRKVRSGMAKAKRPYSSMSANDRYAYKKKYGVTDEVRAAQSVAFGGGQNKKTRRRKKRRSN